MFYKVNYNLPLRNSVQVIKKNILVERCKFEVALYDRMFEEGENPAPRGWQRTPDKTPTSSKLDVSCVVFTGKSSLQLDMHTK